MTYRKQRRVNNDRSDAVHYWQRAMPHSTNKRHIWLIYSIHHADSRSLLRQWFNCISQGCKKWQAEVWWRLNRKCIIFSADTSTGHDSWILMLVYLVSTFRSLKYKAAKDATLSHFTTTRSYLFPSWIRIHPAAVCRVYISSKKTVHSIDVNAKQVIRNVT